MKLKSLTTAIAAMGVAAGAAAGTVTSDGADLVIKTKGGLEVATTDKEYSIKVGGRIQYDYNRAEENGVADEDQFDVRRARLFVSGTIKDWSYKSQFNVDSGGAEDLYIRYNGWGKQAKLTVGRQKMPFGLEELTSSKDISMLERSAITEAYAIGRADGVQLSGKNGAFTYAISGFEADVTDDGADADGNGDDFGLAARGTFAPINEGDTVVHVGVAYQNRNDDLDAFGVELAGVLGPLHGQFEYVDADLGSAGDADGYYVQVGYVITGEQRPYKDGKFKRIKPNSDSGAWEIVARYEDGDGNYSDIELGETDATSWGLGVNWYVNNSVRVGINYTDGEDENSSDDGEEFRARLQLTF